VPEKRASWDHAGHAGPASAAIARFLIAAIVTAAACPHVMSAQTPTAIGAAAPISFHKQVQPIFDANCVVCHQTGGAQAGLVLEDGKAYANLVEQRSHESPMALVTPGSSENSYLIHKINGTQAAAHGNGARMPLGGQLDSSDIDIVRGWIAAGAPNN
jgi:mono/diheme cytochrome c family protein